MSMANLPASAFERTLSLLGSSIPDQLAIRQAAWVARCVGRGDAAPFSREDLSALAAGLQSLAFSRGDVVFTSGASSSGVWIVQSGRVELSVGTGRRRAVVHVLGPGDVDGDIQHLLELPLPYTAHALEDSRMLFLDRASFEGLLSSRISITRRWLSSVATRLAASHERVISLLGHSLSEQVARLLLDESVHGVVPLPQRTLAAMLGVQRPSLNKILKEFERGGLIKIRYGAIDVLDEPGLRAAGG